MKRLHILAAMLLLLLGCTHTGKEGDDYMGYYPRTFSDDVEIVGLQYHHTSTMMEPYYLIEKRLGSYHFVICMDPDSRKGKTSDVKVGKEVIKELSDKLVSAGVLKWDGYQGYKSLGPFVMDGDNGFSLKLQLSDGSVLEASGSNAYPDGYNEVLGIIDSYFEGNQDYSVYYPKKIDGMKLDRLEITVGTPYASQYQAMYRIELSRGWKRWSIVLRDPKGDYLEMGTDIGDYADTEEELPFDRYAELLDRYDILQMNDTSENWDYGKGGQYLQVHGSFTDEKEISISQNIDADAYQKFIKEFIDMTLAYYEEVKQ